jgi:hypothetical protein
MELSQTSNGSHWILAINSNDDDSLFDLSPPLIPAQSLKGPARKSAAAMKRKCSKITHLGSIPAKPIVPSALAMPSKKDLFKGQVSENQGCMKLPGALSEANKCTSALETLSLPLSSLPIQVCMKLFSKQ